MQEQEDGDEECADAQPVDQRQESEREGERQSAEEFHVSTLAEPGPRRIGRKYRSLRPAHPFVGCAVARTVIA
ncbi:hypothetical protein GCM10009587_32920 [Microbacterium maritypicum]